IGKTFKYIEVGVVPEFFCPMQGFHQIHPRQTVQLQTGGQGYNNAIGGWKINDVPLELWGNTKDSFLIGPTVQTSDPAKTLNAIGQLPAGWHGWGGSGGYRLLRFGRFSLKDDTKRKYQRPFLANGDGSLAALYCQSAIIVDGNEDLHMTCEKPIRFVVWASGSGRLVRTRIVQTLNIQFPDSTFPTPELNPGDYRGWTRRFNRAANAPIDRVVDVLGPNDVVKSMILSHGDYRHLACRRNCPAEMFQPHPSFLEEEKAHSLVFSGPEGARLALGTTLSDDLYGRNLAGPGVSYDPGVRPDFTFNPRQRRAFSPLMSPGYQFPIDPSITRDFDNGLGGAADGAYGNKPDDGADDVPGSSIFNQKYPYFQVSEANEFVYSDKGSNFSPNRMITSAVGFGSLPSAFQANAPWTCLLFRPNVSDEPHLGEAGNGLKYSGDRKTADGFSVPQLDSTRNKKLPADHLWLDLFWMPIVQPYPISEPFSTAGKVNLNYQMMPFDYIKRSTALHAVLKSERLLAIPSNAGSSYKKAGDWKSGWHHRIDANQTLRQFEERFADGRAFMTESEICEQFLIPEGETWDEGGAGIRRFWDRHRLTGDNTLEAPYKNLYPRLTTRSNTFKVHLTVQTLKKARSTEVDEFDSETDLVTAEYRGSAIIERYIDPLEEGLPNYIKDLKFSEDNLDYFYRYRIINVKQFAP
ncbi:MAG: Verru_Chthon cassette protein A, partial [Verrucomicrobiota bacterium]